MPAVGYLHVIQKIIKLAKLNLPFGNGLWLDMEDQSPAVMLLVQIYCLLSEGCAAVNGEVQSAYVSTLQSFFKVIFCFLTFLYFCEEELFNTFCFDIADLLQFTSEASGVPCQFLVQPPSGKLFNK